jgi:hypothetical protein
MSDIVSDQPDVRCTSYPTFDQHIIHVYIMYIELNRVIDAGVQVTRPRLYCCQLRLVPVFVVLVVIPNLE